MKSLEPACSVKTEINIKEQIGKRGGEDSDQVFYNFNKQFQALLLLDRTIQRTTRNQLVVGKWLHDGTCLVPMYKGKTVVIKVRAGIKETLFKNQSNYNFISPGFMGLSQG